MIDLLRDAKWLIVDCWLNKRNPARNNATPLLIAQINESYLQSRKTSRTELESERVEVIDSDRTSFNSKVMEINDVCRLPISLTDRGN